MLYKIPVHLALYIFIQVGVEQFSGGNPYQSQIPVNSTLATDRINQNKKFNQKVLAELFNTNHTNFPFHKKATIFTKQPFVKILLMTHSLFHNKKEGNKASLPLYIFFSHIDLFSFHIDYCFFSFQYIQT